MDPQLQDWTAVLLGFAAGLFTGTVAGILIVGGAMYLAAREGGLFKDEEGL